MLFLFLILNLILSRGACADDFDSALWLGILCRDFSLKVLGEVFYEGVAVSADLGLEFGAMLELAVHASACGAVVAGAEGVGLMEFYGGIGAVGVEELYGGDALG